MISWAWRNIRVIGDLFFQNLPIVLSSLVTQKLLISWSKIPPHPLCSHFSWKEFPFLSSIPTPYNKPYLLSCLHSTAHLFYLLYVAVTWHPLVLSSPALNSATNNTRSLYIYLFSLLLGRYGTWGRLIISLSFRKHRCKQFLRHLSSFYDECQG